MNFDSPRAQWDKFYNLDHNIDSVVKGGKWLFFFSFLKWHMYIINLVISIKGQDQFKQMWDRF